MDGSGDKMSDGTQAGLALLLIVGCIIATLMIFGGDVRCLIVECVIVKETPSSRSEHVRELP